MPVISLSQSLLIAGAAQAYGVQATPAFARHDAMGDIGRNPGYTLSGVSLIPEAGILILEPSPLPVASLTTDWDFPDGLRWTQATDSGTNLSALYQPDATANLNFSAVSHAVLDGNAAFCVRIGRGQPSPSATIDGAHVFTTMSVGDDTPPSAGAGAPFRLALVYGRPPMLQAAIPDPGSSDTWVWPPFGQNAVPSTRIARSEHLFDDTARVVNVEWVPVPSSNVLVVRLANGRDTLVFRPDTASPVYGEGLTFTTAPNVSVASGKMRIGGCNGIVSIQYLPMRFATEGTLTSPAIALPFPLPSRWFVRTPAAEYDPNTQTVTGTIVAADPSSRVIQYQVTLTSPPDSSGLAALSPIVREVEFDIPPTYIATAPSPPIDLSAHIADIEEHQWLDPESLTVHTEVGITFDNTIGAFPVTGTTHFAAQYSRGLVVDGIAGPQFTLVTGWGGFQSTLTRADPSRRFDLVIADRSWQLRRSPVGAMPFFDGWCFLAAMRFLANAAGITDNFLGDPLTTCNFGANPGGCPHIQLAQRPGMPSRMRFPADTGIWHAITEIAGYAGWMVGFDSGGTLQTASRTAIANTTPLRGTFTTADTGDPSSPSFLLTIRDRLSVKMDTSTRRTGVAFYGIDSMGHPAASAVVDLDNTYPFFIADIHGFREPLVETSNLLSDPAFAAQYAGSALDRLALPRCTVEFGSSFLPALYVMDQLDIAEDIAIRGTVRANVEELSQTWSATDPTRRQSRILCRVQQFG